MFRVCASPVKVCEMYKHQQPLAAAAAVVAHTDPRQGYTARPLTARHAGRRGIQPVGRSNHYTLYTVRQVAPLDLAVEAATDSLVKLTEAQGTKPLHKSLACRRAALGLTRATVIIPRLLELHNFVQITSSDLE
ncbi:hypothetical protein RRG08_052401 [Elysia crispata]|uniref:Uncharacterized protein n=1 Tax=Elysia crispata TaxID=231223 RepID=A0AAE1B2P3_9GAST|nr:hypothetical protein RRG08_052401 [Elysia crispata]